MLKSILRDYSDVYRLFKGTITVPGEGAEPAAIERYRNDKQALFKNVCLLLTL